MALSDRKRDRQIVTALVDGLVLDNRGQFHPLWQPLQTCVLGHPGHVGDSRPDIGDAHQLAGTGVGQGRNTDSQLVQAFRQTKSWAVQRPPRRLRDSIDKCPIWLSPGSASRN